MEDAIEGLERFLHAVGKGNITAQLTVDQIYAQNQHQTDSFQHPHGGRSHYLGGPLQEQSEKLVRIMADTLISREGSDIVEGMIRVSEEMRGIVENNAPVLDYILRDSGHPTVIDDGVVKYDSPAKESRRLDK